MTRMIVLDTGWDRVVMTGEEYERMLRDAILIAECESMEGHVAAIRLRLEAHLKGKGGE